MGMKCQKQLNFSMSLLGTSHRDSDREKQDPAVNSFSCWGSEERGPVFFSGNNLSSFNRKPVEGKFFWHSWKIWTIISFPVIKVWKALRSHDKFQASHWSSLLSSLPFKNIFELSISTKTPIPEAPKLVFLFAWCPYLGRMSVHIHIHILKNNYFDHAKASKY